MPQSLRDFFLPIHWRGKFLKHTGPCPNRDLPPENINQSKKPCHFRKFKIEEHVVSNSKRVTCRTPQTWHCCLLSFSLPPKVNTNSKQKNILLNWYLRVGTSTSTSLHYSSTHIAPLPLAVSVVHLGDGPWDEFLAIEMVPIPCFPSRPFENTKLYRKHVYIYIWYVYKPSTLPGWGGFGQTWCDLNQPKSRESLAKLIPT